MDKMKAAVVTGVILILAAGTTTVIVKQAANQKAPEADTTTMIMQRTANQNPPTADLTARIEQANVDLPTPQVLAKKLVFSAIAQKRIPDTANWCETLNADGKLWPATSPGTVFAINPEVAGRAFSRGLAGDTVVFFETSNTAWNQAGGPELLAKTTEGVAVALADGRALIVPPEGIAKLRWKP